MEERTVWRSGNRAPGGSSFGNFNDGQQNISSDGATPCGGRRDRVRDHICREENTTWVGFHSILILTSTCYGKRPSDAGSSQLPGEAGADQE